MIKMIQVYLLTLQVLVIYLPYVEVTTGTSCIGDGKNCSSIVSYQCNASSRIHIFCNSGTDNNESCPHTSQCVACNTANGSGTCNCNQAFYEYQGVCYFKHELNATCYNVDSCRDINSVCSNSSGGICVCRPGYYYFHQYGRCAEQRPIGGSCYTDNACRDEHARCIGDSPKCLCMDGYYEHQGSCILKSYLGGICHNHDGCTGEGVVCSSLYNGTCSCNSTHIYYKEKCYHMPDSPNNLQVFNVTATSFTIGFEKPNEMFGELLGYVLKITLADTGICVIEYIIRCTSGCIAPFPNLTDFPTTCLRIIQYKTVSKQDLVMMKHNENTLDPDTVYWVSVSAVGQYGKGFISVINVTTLYQGDLNVGSRSEPNTMTTIIIASIGCGTLIVIALTAAGTIIIIKRRRASKRKNDTVVDSTYMDLQSKANENHYDAIVVTSTY